MSAIEMCRCVIPQAQGLTSMHAGLSDKDLQKDLTKNADFWNKISKRPKEKIKFSFTDKQQFDYVREATSKNVW